MASESSTFLHDVETAKLRIAHAATGAIEALAERHGVTPSAIRIDMVEGERGRFVVAGVTLRFET